MTLKFSEVLHEKQVFLQLEAASKTAAVSALLAALADDERVSSPQELTDAVIGRDAAALEENGIGICIAHGRTNAVRSLVMAAGKLLTPIVIPEISCPLSLIFVAGIPSAFSSDYLRLVGAIARICSSPSQMERLLATREPSEFIAFLEAHTNRF